MQFEFRDKISFWRWSEAWRGWVICPGSHRKWPSQNQRSDMPWARSMLLSLSLQWRNENQQVSNEVKRQMPCAGKKRGLCPLHRQGNWATEGFIVVLTGVDFDPRGALGNIWRHFWLSLKDGEDTTGISLIEDRDAGKHALVHERAPRIKKTSRS